MSVISEAPGLEVMPWIGPASASVAAPGAT